MHHIKIVTFCCILIYIYQYLLILYKLPKIENVFYDLLNEDIIFILDISIYFCIQNDNDYDIFSCK